MRHIVLTLMLICAAATVTAQQSGIQFGILTYSEAVSRAAESQRPVLLYIGHEECGACLTLQHKIFTDRAITMMVNDNFVPISVDPHSSFGKEICGMFDVETHPAFVVLDGNENVRHKFVGVFSKDDFVQQLRIGLDEESGLKEYKRRYAAGDRDKVFLLNYISRMRNAGELTSDMVREYLSMLDYREFNRTENIHFIFEYAMYNMKPTLRLDDPAFKYFVRNRHQFSRYYDEKQVTTRIVLTAYKAAMDAADNQSFATQQRALALLRTFDNGEGYELMDKDGNLLGRISPKELDLTAEINYYYKGFLADQADLRK